jgi:hypothetical protein
MDRTRGQVDFMQRVKSKLRSSNHERPVSGWFYRAAQKSISTFIATLLMLY